MKNREKQALFSLLLAIALWVSGGAEGRAVETTDAAFREATAEMAMLEGLVKILQPGDKATASGYLKRLTVVRELLTKTTAKQHVGYKVAIERFNRLNQKIVAIANSAPDQKVDPRTGEAARRLTFVEGELERLGAEATPEHRKLVPHLEKIAELLNRVGDRQQASWRAAAKRYNLLNDRLTDLIKGLED